MNRKLLILLFCASCSSIRPADPLLVEHALQNESDEGFLSREFFQVKVEVPLTYIEMSGRAKRDECRRVAFLKREEKVVPFLLEVHRDKYRFGDSIDTYNKSKLGKARLKRNASTTTIAGLPGATTTSATTSAIPGSTPVTGQTLPLAQTTPLNSGPPKEDPDRKVYSQVFSWFMNEMILYKEDYSDKSKCTFLFRNIQKDLFAKVENTVIPDSIFKKEEDYDRNEKDQTK